MTIIIKNFYIVDVEEQMYRVAMASSTRQPLGTILVGNNSLIWIFATQSMHALLENHLRLVFSRI